MQASVSVVSAHPQGERKNSLPAPAGRWPVDTPGGRFYAEWDDQAPVTREGQLMFFFQFLHVGGRWEEFLRDCPLKYIGNRGSGAPNVMGTAMLSVLSGHWRYAHINAVRGDGVNPGLLGMSHVVSEDVVRLGIGRIKEKSGHDWLSTQVLDSIAPALHLPWILDIDVTIKPLYGHQQGAEIGYNPQKPGRPSHVYHSYFVANLRLGKWSKERRVILVREAPAAAPVREPGGSRRGKDRQSHLPNAKGPGWEACATPWSGKIAVLVSSLDPTAFPTIVMPKHYRDRADAENCFDELKNQWGWGGYTSRRLASSSLMANLIALFYNWWSLYLRFYDEGHHREAIRTRPMLMSGVGRQVQSGGQRTVKVSVLHERGDLIAHAVTLISKELQDMRAITERWSNAQRWTLLLTRVLRRWLGGKWLPDLPDEAKPLLSG
jgi:hypothetical protein